MGRATARQKRIGVYYVRLRGRGISRSRIGKLIDNRFYTKSGKPKG